MATFTVSSKTANRFVIDSIKNQTSWFIAQVFFLFFYFYLLGKLKVIHGHDSPYYVLLRHTLISEVFLSSVVPSGYPLVLKLVSVISPSLSILPMVQFTILAISIFAFYCALGRYGLSRWLALAISSTIFYSNYTFIFIPMVVTDILATSAVILAISMLIFVICKPCNFYWWFLYSIFLFFSYQTRPAYLFLLVLLPLLGIMLLFLRIRYKRIHFPFKKSRFITTLTITSILPFIFFCYLRFAALGFFGITSSDGWTIAGIAGQFLSEDMARKLPNDLRLYALNVLDERKGFLDWELPGDTSNFAVIERMYYKTVWSLLYPVAEQMYKEKGDVAVKRKLLEFSMAIIRAKPVPYIIWIMKAFRVQFVRLIETNYEFQALTLLFIILQFIYLLKQLYGYESDPDLENRRAGHYYAFATVFLIGVSFALSGIFLISLVVIPDDRYISAAGIFLPSIPAVLILDRCSKIIKMRWPSSKKADTTKSW